MVKFFNSTVSKDCFSQLKEVTQFSNMTWRGLGGKRGAGVPGYGVPGCGKHGVWKTRPESGGKHGVSVENTGSKWKTRGKHYFAQQLSLNFVISN